MNLITLRFEFSAFRIEVPALQSYVDLLVRQDNKQKQIDELAAQVAALTARLNKSSGKLDELVAQH